MLTSPFALGETTNIPNGLDQVHASYPILPRNAPNIRQRLILVNGFPGALPRCMIADFSNKMDCHFSVFAKISKR